MKKKAALFYLDLWTTHPKVHTPFLDFNVVMEVGDEEAHVLGAILTVNGPKVDNVWVYQESLFLKDGKWLAYSCTAVDFLDMTETTWSEATERLLTKYGLDIDQV